MMTRKNNVAMRELDDISIKKMLLFELAYVCR